MSVGDECGSRRFHRSCVHFVFPRIVSDMDEHSKIKADAKVGYLLRSIFHLPDREHCNVVFLQVIVKEAFDTLGSKDDKIVAGYIKVLIACTLSNLENAFP